ncbi:MAG TPA: FtsX-like permease family protein [Mycobacteriales bacterium]
MGVLQTEPWRRAPRLLLRHRAVLAAIAGTCALLAIAAASGPLFLSSAGAAALQRRVAEQCPEADRPRLLASPRSGEATTRAVTAAGLPAPYRVVVDGISAPFGVNTTPTGLTLYFRDDVFDHVRKVTGGGEGLWVSDLDAQRFRVKVGDRIAVGRLSIPVAGLYEDLAGPGLGRTLPPYWCTWSRAIVPTLESRPPPFLLADRPTMDRIVAAYESGDAGQFALGVVPTWYSPVDTAHLTLTEADGVLAAERRLKDAVGGTSANGLAADVAVARATRDGIAGAITPVALAGVLVAVLLVGAAGSFWVDQRRAELRLLGARGIGPPALAGKAVLELGLPALAGAAAGWGAAIVLVRTAGPASELEPGAPWRALAAVLPALAGAVAALAAVAAGRTAERSRHRRLPPVPWELALLALAGWAYTGVGEDAGVVADRLVVRVDPRLVTFGLLGTAGGVLLLARLLTALLPWLRRRTAAAPAPLHLAVRRLAGLRTATAAVLVATAVPVAILGYAGAITRSTDASVVAKARTYAGTEHAIVVNAAPAQTLPVGDTGTQVSVIRDVRTVAGGETQVLGIDPATFARFAYTDPRVFGADLPGLVRRLDGPGLPALAIDCPACGPRVRMTLGRSELTATVVGTARLFPGIRVRDSALLVVPRTALADIDRYSNRVEEIWTTSALLPSAVDTVTRAGLPPLREVSPTQFLGNSQLLPVTWTFGYLQALAVLIGLIGMAGLFLFLAARQRSTLVSYVLLRRIGLSRRAHLGSLAGELGGVLAAGWLLGAGSAVGFAAAVRGLLDINPLYPPGSLLVLPVALLAAGIGVLLAVAAVGALGTQRVADAAEPAILLRGADS